VQNSRSVQPDETDEMVIMPSKLASAYVVQVVVVVMVTILIIVIFSCCGFRNTCHKCVKRYKSLRIFVSNRTGGCLIGYAPILTGQQQMCRVCDLGLEISIKEHFPGRKI
jgi:hypothetical protein